MRRPGTQFITYALLAAGAVVFAFPFIWLVSTSLKVDRELFTGHLNLIPERPVPRARSPYFDERPFAQVSRNNPTLPTVIRGKLDEFRDAIPSADSQVDVDSLLSTGIIESLQRRTPDAIWNDQQQLIRFAQTHVAREHVEEVVRATYRELGIGVLRVRDSKLHEMEIAASASAWQIDSARILDRFDGTLNHAAVHYDFAQADRFVLKTTIELPFAAGELHRVQLRLRPDDTWHELHLKLDIAGVRYESSSGFPLVDAQWTTVAWQRPSGDDRSTKLRQWIVLDEVARGAEFDPGQRAARIQLELRQSTPLRAAFAKARYNYARVLEKIPFWRYVRISVLLVVLNIVLALFSSSLVAYAFARLHWPGRDFAFVLLLGTMMIPGQVTMIPNFLIWKNLGAYNTLIPLWAGAAFGNAFFIFLMRQFLRGVPRDLEDAARIDGCGFLRTWWHVMLPLVKPSLAAIAIFTFIGTWNDFLGPLIYVADQRLYPLAFGLYAFAVHVGSNPVLTMAASVLMTLPVIAIFFVAQRYFIQGVTLTGLKG